MSNPRTLARLEDMLRYSQEAVDITKGKTRQDLDGERVLNLAVVCLLEIIGEAANQIPIVWQVVTENLPPLIAQLSKIIATQKLENE